MESKELIFTQSLELTVIASNSAFTYERGFLLPLWGNDGLYKYVHVNKFRVTLFPLTTANLSYLKDIPISSGVSTIFSGHFTINTQAPIHYILNPEHRMSSSFMSQSNISSVFTIDTFSNQMFDLNTTHEIPFDLKIYHGTLMFLINVVGFNNLGTNTIYRCSFYINYILYN